VRPPREQTRVASRGVENRGTMENELREKGTMENELREKAS
jgi:hypothetical protein